MSQASSTVAASATQGKARRASARRFTEATARTDVISLETAARLCPNPTQAANIARAFGLADVDGTAVREQTEEAIAAAAKALDGALNETALRIHLQRVVDGFVRSAHGAGTFYDTKAATARELSSALSNEDRDEDRMGVDGMANRAERARDFAATAGLQAFALMCAAEGAASAYAHITGEDWKPYAKNVARQVSTERRAVSEQLAAFN